LFNNILSISIAKIYPERHYRKTKSFLELITSILSQQTFTSNQKAIISLSRKNVVWLILLWFVRLNI